MKYMGVDLGKRKSSVAVVGNEKQDKRKKLLDYRSPFIDVPRLKIITRQITQ